MMKTSRAARTLYQQWVVSCTETRIWFTKTMTLYNQISQQSELTQKILPVHLDW